MLKKDVSLIKNKKYFTRQEYLSAPVTWASTVNQKGENTYDDYDRNRNAITTGSRVMVSGTVTLARSCRLILKV